jgi:hypothetical protein
MFKKKLIFIILACTPVFGTLIGCNSVPEVKRFKYDDAEKKYDVVIDKDYIDNPVELKYALNSFVKEMGGTSYDVLKHGTNDFYVTIPGKTPVEDLPEVKHWHVGKMVWAGIGATAGIIVIIIFSLIYAGL